MCARAEERGGGRLAFFFFFLPSFSPLFKGYLIICSVCESASLIILFFISFLGFDRLTT